MQKKLGPAWTQRGRPPAGYFTKRLAEAWLRSVLDDARRGVVPGQVRTGATFADAAAEYLRYIEHDRGRKPSTLRGYRSALQAHLLPAFGSMAVEDVTSEAIERWIAGFSGSVRTRNKLLIELHGIPARAKKVYGSRVNAAGEIERFPQRMSGEIEVFSPACYPLAATDGDGQPLDSEHRYTLHFEHDQLPPVNAFWSLTMYDPESYLVDNAIDRYTLGDRSGLTYADDGSLTLTVQREAPDASPQTNWLPTPADGAFKVALRLYSPKPEVAAGNWRPRHSPASPSLRFYEPPATSYDETSVTLASALGRARGGAAVLASWLVVRRRCRCARIPPRVIRRRPRRGWGCAGLSGLRCRSRRDGRLGP